LRGAALGHRLVRDAVRKELLLSDGACRRYAAGAPVALS